MFCLPKNSLPCFSYISTGKFFYHNKCHFIHDPRVQSTFKFTDVRIKNCTKNSGDLFFWPPNNFFSENNITLYYPNGKNDSEISSELLWYCFLANISSIQNNNYQQGETRSKLDIWKNTK
jgi:hypothetical protein